MKRALLLLVLLATPLLAQTEVDVSMPPPAVAVPPDREEDFVSAATFGQRYFAAEDMKSAYEELSKADAIAPNHPGVLYNLTVVLMRMGRFAEAQEKIDTYRALYPEGDQTGAIRKLQVDLNWARDVQRRQQLNQTYIELFNRGKFNYDKGNFDEALAAFRQAEAERPDDSAAIYNQAVALEALGDYAGATERLRHYLSLGSAGAEKSTVDAKLFELEAAINDERSSIVCGFCGAKLPAGATWCHHCWRGPYLTSAPQWNTRSCATGATATRSTFFAGGKLNANEDLPCLYPATWTEALKYSKAKQKAIQAERQKEGWTYTGDDLAGFKGRDDEITIDRDGDHVKRIFSQLTGDVLSFEATPAGENRWLLSVEDRTIEGQKFNKRYAYDDMKRVARETVRYQAANRCGHIIEVIGEYVYENDRLAKVNLTGGYDGYPTEGAPKARWTGQVVFTYDGNGVLQQEELNVQTHEKTYSAKVPGKLFDQLETFYPGFRGKVAQNILAKGDVCTRVGGRWVQDPIDLRAFDTWSPNLAIALPLGVTRAVVSFTYPAAQPASTTAP